MRYNTYIFILYMQMLQFFIIWKCFVIYRDIKVNHIKSKIFFSNNYQKDTTSHIPLCLISKSIASLKNKCAFQFFVTSQRLLTSSSLLTTCILDYQSGKQTICCSKGILWSICSKSTIDI